MIPLMRMNLVIAAEAPTDRRNSRSSWYSESSLAARSIVAFGAGIFDLRRRGNAQLLGGNGSSIPIVVVKGRAFVS